MRIGIFGTGAVGGYFGGRLALAGNETIFIARGEHLRALQQSGLRVESIKGDFHIYPVLVTDDPDQVGQVDAVLFCVKAWQVIEAASAMKHMLGSDSFVIPLGNGVEIPMQLSQILGSKYVLGGLCRISSIFVEPGLIRHVGIEPYIAFGELDGRDSQRVTDMHKIFTRAGIKADISANIQVDMWLKFLFIASLSGLGAITRTPASIFRNIPETHSLLESALAEIVAVAEAQGIKMPNDSVVKTLAIIDTLPDGVLASMHRDMIEGRPSELEYQNGTIVRLGREYGIATPVHEFIYKCLLPQEKIARREI